MTTKPRVAVSYSWKEESSSTANGGAVEEFCRQLSQRGIEVVRDKDRLKHGESIREFMRDLGASKFLCVFLSDGYLRSPNCMYELLVAWQRSRDHAKEFGHRVKIWVMPGLETIQDMAVRAKYVNHWESEYKRLKPFIEDLGPKGKLGPGSQDEFNWIGEFERHVDAILHFAASHLSPGSPEEYAAWIQSCFPDATTDGGGDAPDPIANLADELGSLVQGNSVVREFLQRETRGLFEDRDGRWQLTAAARAVGSPVCDHLKRMNDALARFSGQPKDWRDLGQIAGGLIVLSVDREWVRRQASKARLDSATYPATAPQISIGDGWLANLEHVVSSALADTCARLVKVFGDPVIDPHRLPPAAEVARSIGRGPSHLRETKLHFIRAVLGPKEVFDENDARKVDLLFQRTRSIIRSAFADDRHPYLASDESYRGLKETIRKDLRLEDLLLIAPDGEDPAKLLTDDYLRMLRFLKKISDAVAANAPT